MCFHSRAEYDAWVANMRRASERDRAAGKHAKSEEKYALIVLRCEQGNFIAGWHCDPRDAQDVANTIQDLKHWHAGEFKYVDTSDVDKARARLKLEPLDQNGLPLPNRLPRESVDKLVEEWDLTNKSALPSGYFGKGGVLERRETRRREAERREQEIQNLATSLGLTVEEVKARQAQLVHSP